jgi:hypothetical protein
MKADFLRELPQTDACIDWPFALGGDGYPYCWFDGSVQKATRVAMKLNGKDPGDLFALHTCDRPACVNPRHLFAGTQKDNMQDALRKNRCRGGNVKLTPIQVAEIRASTELQQSIADRFGVDQSHISRIRSGKYWR